MQVVRKEHFAHTYDPSISIKKKGVRFSSSLIQKLIDVYDVIFLIDPINMKLVVKPASRDDRDSVTWARIEAKTGKKVPKENITAARLTQKIYNDMNWDINTWYKIIGTVVNSNGEILVVFNLKDAEQHIVTNDNRKVLLPKEWENSYGYIFTERDKYTSIGVLNDYQKMENIIKRVKKIENNAPIKED